MSSHKLYKKSLATAVAAVCLPVMSLGLTSNVSADGMMKSDMSMTGNIGVFSKYVLRGIHQGGGESAGAVLQGGFDMSHDSGISVGYWGSNLGYADAGDGSTGFENDFYASYGGEAAGVSYSLGVVYYKYLKIADSDAPEITASLGYGPVSLGVNYLLTDVVWGNAGDTYLTLNLEQGLPKDFTVGVNAGYYMYTDSGDFIQSSKLDSGFRHLNVSLSHPIGKTGADMSITGIYGGVDRNDTEQGVTAALGLSYGFDI